MKLINRYDNRIVYAPVGIEAVFQMDYMNQKKEVKYL